MSHRKCPSAEDLSAYVAGRLPSSLWQAVEEHLESCNSCQADLEMIPSTNDSLVAVLAQPSPPEAFLDHTSYLHGLEQACLLGRRLLAKRDMSDGPLVADPPNPKRVGPYLLVRKIGEGGMGTVWLAKQTEPVKRAVAIKFIKPGMDGAQILARFEAERQALALMDHPNIARVLDGGLQIADYRLQNENLSDDPAKAKRAPNNLQSQIPHPKSAGRPFFVMELVKGLRITKYCDQHRLTTRARLELFVPVCHAVQHAHQKGIIHRDLKPSNVLIASYDGKPVPKVIDFGVAKATGQKLTERTMVTGFGGIVGTLEYMSPEQAEYNAVDIDTRSDIFALGVLLYELLTGTTPLARNRLKEAGPAESLRLIREEEPPRPSTRLRESRDQSPDVAAQRQTDSTRLIKEIQGDLDWLVLKALEKDRGRRYETANALALDIERYLADEPVLASPPSAVYRLRKFAKRHRGPLLAAAVVVLALVGGMVGTALGMFEARAQRDAAELAQHNEELQRLAAVAESYKAAQAERDAQQRAREARQSEKEARSLWDFFKNNVVDAARPPDQFGGLGTEATIGGALHAAEPGIAAAFQDQPLVEASLRGTLGTQYVNVGNFKLAIDQHLIALKLNQDQLGPQHADTLTAQANLAAAYHAAGRMEEAVKLSEETLALRKASLGPEDQATLTSMYRLAALYLDMGRATDGLGLHLETLELRKSSLGPDHTDSVHSEVALAVAFIRQRRPAEALPLLEHPLKVAKAKLPHDHPTTLTYMTNLAHAYMLLGRFQECLPIFQEVLKVRQEAFGLNHRETLVAMSNLASAYLKSRRSSDALPLFEDALARGKKSLGLDQPVTLIMMTNLALAYQQVGRHKEAIVLLEASLKLLKEHFQSDEPNSVITVGNSRPDHPDILMTMNSLAAGYLATGRAKEAVPLCVEVMDLAKSHLGPQHPKTLEYMGTLTKAYHEAGRFQEGLANATEALKLHQDQYGVDHRLTLSVMNGLANLYFSANRLTEAEPLYDNAATTAREKLGIADAEARLFMDNLAACREKMMLLEKAEALRQELTAYSKQKDGPESAIYSKHLLLLGRNLLQQRKFDQAEPILRDSLKIAEKREPDAWATFFTKSLLGASLEGQKQYAAAEPFLLEGYKGLKDRADRINPQLRVVVTEALERIVQLYDAWDRPEQAARWRQELPGSKQKKSGR